jgi:rfaE bifunctional protein nucleotidyltransferase chain/domain
MTAGTGGTAAKIRSRASAVAWRAGQRGRVAFTNGVFDLLHPGHVELLEAARREGDALIVGVNSDASVRRLGKGADRPLAAEDARARVLAGLGAVDCVVLFEEDTPLELIRALEPDVLVKGADYPRDRIVGADWVEARGGRVVRVPVVPGFSTTALVERLRAPS